MVGTSSVPGVADTTGQEVGSMLGVIESRPGNDPLAGTVGGSVRVTREWAGKQHRAAQRLLSAC